MPDFDPAEFRLMRKGNAFEDFTPGRAFEHHWGRTLTDGDNALFTTATLAYNPLYFNAEYARAEGHPDVVVNPMLVLCTVVGLSVEDLSEAGGPFLGVDELTFHRAGVPRRHADRRSSTVVSARESDSRPDFGIVTWHTEGRNQRGELVVDYKRTQPRRQGARRAPRDAMSDANPYLTDERLAIQAEARRFAMDEVLPLANELDPQKADIPRDFLRRIGAQGYFGIMIGREFGGMGLGVFEYALITEELARAWMSVASIIARGNGMGTHAGDPARRAELLRSSAGGEWIGAAALSEPGAGSDLANVQCRADATATSTSSPARSAGAATRSPPTSSCCSRARPTPRRARTARAGSRASSSRRSATRFPDGLTGTPIDKIGYYGITTYHLVFDGLRVPADALLGARGERRDAHAARRRPRLQRDDARAEHRAHPHGGARRSASRAARSRTRWRTRRSACSSGGRSASSRRSASSSPTWRRRSRPRARSCTRSRSAATPASRSRRRRRW